jgi:DNA (cytosine-5)-methyltransferase 1
VSAYYNEFDTYAAQWLRNLIAAGHIAPGDVDERSIVDVRPDDLRGYTQCHFFAGIGGWSLALRLAGWDDDRPVWSGSCPCQPFSAAGKRKAGADDRHLWPVWFRLIRECRPDRVFGEQVEAAVGLGWLDRVFADLEGEAYACGAAVLGAHSVGAPHIRQRLWWVADSDEHGAQRLPGDDGEAARVQEEERAELGAVVPQRSGATRRLAHTNGGPCGQVREIDRGRLQGSDAFEGTGPRGDGVPGGLGDADEQGSQGRRDGSGEGGCADQRTAGPAGVAGFWSAFDLIPCADGKARRVEPGTFPLVDGSAFKLGSSGALEGKSRVGMLRAYGNAIVAPVAAEFVRTFMECRP